MIISNNYVRLSYKKYIGNYETNIELFHFNNYLCQIV